ncbi:MAG: replication-relaxation family protein [Terriglobales bacterium]
MTGSNRCGMVLQERDLHLMRELAIVRVTDRELAKAIAGFGSTTRANARLLALVRAGLLRRYLVGSRGLGQKFFYGLTPKGARVADVPMRGPQRRSDRPLVADFFFEHQMAINEVYRLLKYPPAPLSDATFRRWQSFYEPVTAGSRLIPDGYAEVETPAGILAAFLEVDLGNESLSVWKRKVEGYVQFAVSGDFAGAFGQTRFRVLVVGDSSRRMESLRRTTAAVTDRVFWFATLEAVTGDGLFAPIWLRPVGTERQPLVGNQS